MKNRKNRGPFGDIESLFNDLNSMFGGLTPMSFNGNSKTEEGIDDGGKWVKQTFMSDDGSIAMTSFYRNNDNNVPGKTSKIDSLKLNLSEAIENENFEKAITIRDEIKKYEENADKIFDLKNKLVLAVQSQDFETAIKLRDELKNL